MSRSERKHDVVGIGNALVDILCHVEESVLRENGVNKGVMQLIDLPRAAHLYQLMANAEETCGGSAANTVAGIAMLGGCPAFIGKVKSDHLGRVFEEDIRALGAGYSTPPSPGDACFETGRCMVLITPDGERSMNTYLGASEFLSPADIDESLIADSGWIYLEGYRLDGAESRDAFRKAVECCHAHGGKVSLTLSDPHCVERHRGAFHELVRLGVDLVFCNRHELLAYYEAAGLDEALEAAADEFGIVACTDSENGAVIAAGRERHRVAAFETSVVDATGAGDFFAAGMLRGLTSGRDLEDSGRMGCLAASEVVARVGARPTADLKGVFRRRGLA